MTYHTEDEDFYRKLDIAPPSIAEHGTEEDIREKLVPMMPKQWRQEGNQLIGETEAGTHSQTIPTNKLLIGTDDKGLPIFRDIVI